MSKFEPNSFQITNAFVDESLTKVTGNAVKLYLIIVRKTRGWHKEYDSISVSQFSKYSGIKKDLTITNALKELVNIGLINIVKKSGEINKYRIENHHPKKVLPKKGSTTQKRQPPPPKKGSTTTPQKGYSTKDTIKNNITKEKKKEKEKLTIPESLNTTAWESWIDYKKAIKNEYKTLVGKQTAINQLAKLEWGSQQACINHSIQNEYKGFFTDKFEVQKNATHIQNTNRKLTPAEQAEQRDKWYREKHANQMA